MKSEYPWPFFLPPAGGTEERTDGEGGFFVRLLAFHTLDSQCDCACPVEKPRYDALSFPNPRVYWKRALFIYRAPVTDGSWLCYAPAHGSVPAVLNRQAVSLLDVFEEPRPLGDAARSFNLPPGALATPVKALAMAGLIRPAREIPRSKITTTPFSGTLTLWLHLTNACNLRCPYCYVPHNSASMEESAGKGAIEKAVHLLKSRGGHTLHLKYAGGEPALAFPLLQRLHSHARKLAARHGLNLKEAMLSNGTLLTREVLSFLKQEGIGLMVSIDALPGDRHPLHQAETLRAKMRSLDMAGEMGITPFLSMTITARNLAAIPAIVDFAMEREWPLNLNFYRSPGGPDELWPELQTLVRALKEAAEVIEGHLRRHNAPVPTLDRLHLSTSSPYPCSAGRDYFAVGIKGEWLPCPMLMGAPEDRAALPPVSATEKANCIGCTWRYLCGGGCPLLSQRWYSTVYASTPYCEVYKALIPLWLRLEAIRIIKWQTRAVNSQRTGTSPRE